MVSIAIVICKHLSRNKPLSLSSWTAGAWTTLRFVSTSHKSARSWTSFDFANLFKIKWAYSCSRFISKNVNYGEKTLIMRMKCYRIRSFALLSDFSDSFDGFYCIFHKFSVVFYWPKLGIKNRTDNKYKKTYIFLLFSNSRDASQVSSLPLAFL